ncbi:MAG: GNAT family N-acetyltransferase [Candidatus Heimdallarchaeota archaeon]|nr:MAG: GNAT family N-acetyltransferase [Candidatus Heimdallarchaeota archaeon]
MMLDFHNKSISSNPPINLVKARFSDFKFLEEVSHLEMDHVVSQSWNWRSWFEDLKKAIIGNLYYHKVFIIEVEQGCVGYLWLNEEKNSLWVTAIVLQAEFQRRGIGQQIMNFLIEESRKEGKENIELGVQNNNIAALSFYSNLGFKKFDYVKSANTDLFRLKLSSSKDQLYW